MGWWESKSVFASLLGYLVLTACGGNAGGGTSVNSPNIASLAITTSSIPDATISQAYTVALTAAGGTPPYVWQLAPDKGNLPPGLTLAENGTISGTPSRSGAFPFAVRLTDSTQPSAQIANQQLTINVLSVGLLAISTAPLPIGAISKSYSAALAATGGTPPYTWQLSTGSANLPSGLTLTASGTVSGTPVQAGVFLFTVQVIDQTQTVAIRLIDFLVITASGTIYYVDATNGNDGNNGTSATSAWQTLGNASSARLFPGDQVLLKRGEVWREQLTVTSSGSLGNPLLFGAYGSGNDPIINASDVINHWSPPSGAVYSAPVSWSPSHIWQDGVLLAPVTSLPALTAAGEWFYDTALNKLYVWASDSKNPSIHAMEADHRDAAVAVLSNSNIIITDLFLKNSTAALVNVTDASGVAVINCGLQNAKGIAVSVVGKSPGLLVAHTIYYTDPGFQGRAFVSVNSTTADGPVVSDNMIGNFGGVVGIWFQDVNNAVAFGNTIFGNGIGIAVNAVSRSVNGAQLYDNSISDVDATFGDGEAIELTGTVTSGYTVTATVYGNLVKGGSHTFGGIDGFLAINCPIYRNIIISTSRYGFQWTTNSLGNLFINNTVYNNGQLDSAGFGFASSSIGNVIKNNIVKGSSYGIAADNGTASTTMEDYNILNVTTTVRAPGMPAGAHTLTSDPIFVSGSPQTSSDLRLQSGSPAIGSGAPLGVPYKWALDPNGIIFPYPFIDQDLLGSGWERGAFAFR